MQDEKCCLFVCPFSPARNAAKAGHRLAYEFIVRESLTTKIDLVLVLGSSESIALELAELPNVEVVAVVRVGRLDKINAIAANAWRLAPRFATRFSTKAKAAVRQQLRARRYDEFRAEFSQSFAFAELARSSHPDIRIVLSVHDIQLQLVLTKHKLESALFSAFTRASERRLLNLADQILTLSDKDRQFVTRVYNPSAAVHSQAVPLSDFVTKVRRTELTVEPKSLVFWGAMGRVENERAVLEFVEQVFHPLRRRHPDTRLYIVGSAPPASILRLRSESITVTGFVDDPTPYFELAAWGVVPLVEGAGIKLKTLELLAAGVPVLSTPIGAEGIDQTPRLHVRSLDSFRLFLEEHFGAVE